MIDLPGLISISLVFIITCLIILRFSDISKILLTAFVIRILFLLTNNYLFFLPDGDMDALGFEMWAWRWSENGIIDIFRHFKGPDPYFISFIMAIPYSIFGRSMLMLQSFSLLMGIFSVYLGWSLGKKLWNDQVGIKVGWTLALFPTLISYSVLVMREPYIVFFLILAIHGVVSWFKDGNNLKSFLIVILGFVGATFFHGASIVGLIVFLFIIVFENLKSTFKLLKKGKLNLKSLIFITFSFFMIGMFTYNKVEVPYIGNLEYISNPEHLKETVNVRSKGGAAYPEWTKIDDEIELLYKIPVRVVYFLFSPFPWDVKKTHHLIGVLDSFLYITLIFLIIRNFKVIWNDPILKTILLIMICYFILFSVGVSNFGTGIRHRSKFVFGLILLAAPFIPRFKFFNKKKNNHINNK